MTTTWNNTSPAMGNQISADIPDIAENFAHIKSGLVRIFQTAWSDSDLTSHVLDSSVGFSDGTYTYTFPTNPTIEASSIIMLGDSDTIVWMYLNTAPPGWKALSTGADMVLAIAGGSGDYNVEGGNPDTSNTWTIDGLSSSGGSHAHTAGTHTHPLGTTASASSYTGSTSTLVHISSNKAYITESGSSSVSQLSTPTSASSGNTGTSTSHSHTISQNASWRPKASVGKLFQLDTA